MSRLRYAFYAAVLIVVVVLTYLDSLGGWLSILPPLLAFGAMVAVELIQHKNAQLNLVAESINHLICIQERNGRTFLNQRWREYSGDGPNADLDFWHRVIHPEDIGVVKSIYEASQSSVSPYMFEYRIRRADGAYRWHLVRGNPIVKTNGSVERWVSTSTDIHDQKTMEAEKASLIATAAAAAEIKRSEQLLDALVQNIPTVIFVKDAKDLRYLRVNKAGEDLLGVAEKDLLGKVPTDFFPKEQAEKFCASDWEAIHSEKMLDIPRHEVTFVGKGQRIMHTKKFVITSGDGRKLLVVVSNDITDIVNVETKMIHAREQAEQIAKIKSEFLANMSHEIRTPLNGVIGMTELILEGELNPQQKKYLEIVQDSGKALFAIVNDVLDFSKIDAGQVELESIPFDLRTFFENHLGLLQIRAKAKEISLTHSFDNRLPEQFVGDPNRIAQILNNLISNAIKFTDYGKIEIRAQALGDLAGAPRIQFTVTDTGIGISELEQTRLFKPFVQGDGSMARKYGGTGLGLSICKKLVELMGGEIGVESIPETGTTFWFTLTLKAGKAPQKIKIVADSTPIPLRVAKVSEPIHVLIAEDNLNNQILAEALVKRLGYIPHLAVNGKEAFEAVQKFEYALVLMDCQMPEMDGYEATRQIREHEKTSKKRTPIVALTANARPEDREKCLNSGMDDFISKPIRREALEKAMAEWANVNRLKVAV